MSVPGDLICGMWGTTHLTLWRMTGDEGAPVPNIQDSLSGPGAAKINREDFERVVFDLVEPWLDEGISQDILLAGMVGSTIGWVDVPYVACPSTPFFECHSMQCRDAHIYIVPGMSCRNEDGAPNVMRGEETEIAGWLALDPLRREGAHLVVIPGTHTKWVRVEGGIVTGFLTSVAGELFAGFRQSGVIIPIDVELGVEPGSSFLEAVVTAQNNGSLVHDIFSVRARQVLDAEDVTSAAERLSGLIIGADISGALQAMRDGSDVDSVTLIGAPHLQRRYEVALEAFDIKAQTLDAELAATAGLWAIAQRGGLSHAG
ncbi:2-dehydro-3-deoxygalactonokinase [Parvularcula marina]|uniref:2-dehydro-3-deoxygalactonokinase n=1 Tax=Parvularcula marina TaxID=2292771 RepID=A0A371RGL2_9PROT|nr:2-dehydro-3-deoxygalactonokinase [Parvularcula marina]RFB04586.1 2-dehydro-3-deoxygalactonokinase [Parvularcula marina]